MASINFLKFQQFIQFNLFYGFRSRINFTSEPPIFYNEPSPLKLLKIINEFQ